MRQTVDTSGSPQGPRLIPRLRSIQESHGYLPREKLESLATDLDLPLHRIHEVVSFFPHFRLSPSAPVQIRVCRDLACHHAGSQEIQMQLEQLRQESGADQICVEWTSCLGRCDQAPAVQTEFEKRGHHPLVLDSGSESLPSVTGQIRRAIVQYQEGRTELIEDEWHRSSYQGNWKIDYLRHDGVSPPEPFTAVRNFARKLVGAETEEEKSTVFQDLNDQLRSADLRGMGGAGVPAWRKWQDVRNAPGDQRFIVCNADESEPLTFKDRELLLNIPEIVLEGMIFGALYSGATKGYVYVRHEYPAQIRAMKRAIARAKKSGILGHNIMGTGQNLEIEVFISPGGYVCGEQSALIEAIEENRSEPRNKPPQLETNGLYDCPTLLNNVETFAWVPAIVHHGGPWYAESGVHGGPWYGRPGRRTQNSRGLRFFSLCGDVNRPGVHEVPNGTTLGELINLCGGMLENRPIFAWAPSGPSGGFLPGFLNRGMIPPEYRRNFPAGVDSLDIRDLPLDLDEFRSLGLSLGAGMMVFAERPEDPADMLEMAINASQFYRRESCGKCVPCRIGCQKLVEIGQSLKDSESQNFPIPETVQDLIDDLAETMELTSICGLGTSAPKPLSSYLAYFRKSAGLEN